MSAVYQLRLDAVNLKIIDYLRNFYCSFIDLRIRQVTNIRYVTIRSIIYGTFLLSI